MDLWGGYRNARHRTPWQEDTLVLVFSTTKGLAAMTLAVAHSRGWLDYDQRIAAYWPEFAQRGKEKITVRQLLAHQAGLCGIDQPLSVDTLADPDAQIGFAYAPNRMDLGRFMLDPREKAVREALYRYLDEQHYLQGIQP